MRAVITDRGSFVDILIHVSKVVGSPDVDIHFDISFETELVDLTKRV